MAPAATRLVDEVGDDLGVGLRRELAARGLQAIAQDRVILDDAVVDDGHRRPTCGDARSRRTAVPWVAQRV